jgi:hypothetical protein
MSRLLLQICTGLLSLIPIGTGIVTMLGVKDPLYRPLELPYAPVRDSNLQPFKDTETYPTARESFAWRMPSSR